MTFEIGLLLTLVAVALILFSLERISADVVGMGLLLTLIATGLLPPDRAFAGFGSDTVIMILSLLTMTAALEHTGMVDLAGRAILHHAGEEPNRLLLVVLLAAAVLSAFISNTAAVAFFLPVVMGVARKARVSPGRLLLPLAFASVLTSSVTLVSTSTNLVVSGLMTHAGLPRMGMFELAPVGIPIAACGLAYVFFIGRRLLPERPSADGLIEKFGVRSYLTEVLILEDSPLVGKTIGESDLGRELDLTIVRVIKVDDPERHRLPRSDMLLAAGDILVVEGLREDVLKIKDTAGIDINPDVKLADPALRSEDAALVEALIVPDSPLVGRTLGGTHFRARRGVQVLGINRHGRTFVRKLSAIELHAGDVLLIQGPKARIAHLADDRTVSILGEVYERRIDRPRAWRAAGIFAGSLLLATAGVLPLAAAGFLGAFLVFATRCVSPLDVYREVDWRVVILIGCMLGLGETMHATGTAEYLASLLAWGAEHMPMRAILAGFFVLTVLLTQPMSNQAAAAVVVPVAIATAHQLEVNPRSFVMMIAVAASCSYLTPLEPACLMVYGPGRYKFHDFLRVGLPLTILIFLIALWLVPLCWPLQLPES